MPNVSKETASERITFEGIDVRLENFEGGYSVCFESHTADADLADLFRGLPDDRAQLPRWGYVIRGKVGFRFSDGEESYEAGDAYYVPPGHTPIHYAGAEIVEFITHGDPRRDDPDSHEEPAGGRDRVGKRLMSSPSRFRHDQAPSRAVASLGAGLSRVGGPSICIGAADGTTVGNPAGGRATFKAVRDRSDVERALEVSVRRS